MIVIIVATIAAAASLAGAIISGHFARSTQRLSIAAEERRTDRQRLVETRREMYEPIVQMLVGMFTSDDLPTEEELAHKKRFDTWVNVYGSSGVVKAYSRFLMSTQTPPPAEIQFRLYGDLLVEIRRDLGDGDQIDVLTALAPSLSDLADKWFLTKDLKTVCQRLGWAAPWQW